MHTIDPPDRTLPSTFSAFTKQQALRILLDYSASTGKKWQSIRREIMDQSSVKASGNATLLVRQDLEKWASGDSVLGDRKFARVYEFLTHPSTLARPEFFRAAALLGPRHNLLRTGGAISEFYNNLPMAFGDGLSSPKDPGARATAICGIYVGSSGEAEVCLSIEKWEKQDIFVAHYLESDTSFAAISDEWNIMRYSGYATFGSVSILHLKGVLDRRTRVLVLVPPIEWSPVRELRVISQYLFDTVRPAEPAEPGDEVPIMSIEAHYLLKRSDNPSLLRLIDTVRWDVPQ